jgi:hypothetical protein
VNSWDLSMDSLRECVWIVAPVHGWHRRYGLRLAVLNDEPYGADDPPSGVASTVNAATTPVANPWMRSAVISPLARS